ncbi:hypothetical protein [Pseudomonas japonica]|uniref:hypothetical protein n=1 Tax=Pseudomonas japonica TaxID=256466 RepID=UPI0015E34A8B|nr:hypothetical protein [Pseudomonas japonica]MBA1245836.1 hypothetical protein [Pseudomonas japonica]MBA1245933.1 hypothetical protein [Pseudomonas japonica]
MDNRHVPQCDSAQYEAWFQAEAALRMNARRLPQGKSADVRTLVGEEIWLAIGDLGKLFGKHVAKNEAYFSLKFDRLQGTRSLYLRRTDGAL